MTIADQTPVLPSRRDALEHLDVLRELVADVLDRPTSMRLRTLVDHLQGFLRFEAAEVLPDVGRNDVDTDLVEDLTTGHDGLAARLNGLAWAVSGSSEMMSEAHHLRHELLAQVERYQRLRLPRGSLITGS